MKRSIEVRLRHLERTAKRLRRRGTCPVCRDWPSVVVTYADTPDDELPAMPDRLAAANPSPLPHSSPANAHAPRAPDRPPPPSDAAHAPDEPPHARARDEAPCTAAPGESPSTPVPAEPAHGPAPRKRCPACGWQPAYVEVVYVDDWREATRRYMEGRDV